MRRMRRVVSLADSPIARGLATPLAVLACIVGMLAVAHDFAIVSDGRWSTARRAVPPLLAFAALCVLGRRDIGAFGLRARPLPSVAFWARAVLAIACLFAALGAGVVVVYAVAGWTFPIPPPANTAMIWSRVVESPLVEELVYRLLFVTGLAAVAPRWAAVVISGVVFAGLHFVYGNAGPDNFIGGYIFAWLYLRSGTVVVPLAFHVLGNSALLVVNTLAHHALA